MEDIFTLVGKVTVDKDGAVQNIEEITDTAEKSSSKLEDLGKVAVQIGKVIATGLAVGATAVSALTKQAVDAYANYEQLVGGVETLFGAQGMSLQEYADSVGKTTEEAKTKYDDLITAQTNVFENAKNAWYNQGLSANEYMETVTSFSASLVSSLGNDTVKASQVANIAITDMSDNANKMGTSMEAIQNAYNGFAKQNYTMLDNLKLGYGGTKEEMERLLADAEKIKKANGETVSYSISSFADMVEAIHVVQDNMGITGTTAKEASTTIQGSMNAMKGAWTNVLTGLADDTQDFDALITNLIDSVSTVASNLIPRIQIVFQQIPNLITKLMPQLTTLITSLLPSLISATVGLFKGIASALPSLISTLVSTVSDMLPDIISAVGEILQALGTAVWDILQQVFNSDLDVSGIVAFMDEIGTGIQEKIPELLAMVLPMILQFSQQVLENAPQLIEAGMNLIANIIQGLIDSLPDLIAYVPEIITNFADTISQSMEIIIGKGAEIIWNIITGLISAIPDLIANIGDIIQMIISVWEAIQWLNLGKNLINGIKNGISALKDGFTDYVKDIFDKIKEWIKSIFTGVHSDSTSIWGKIFDTIKGVASNIFNSIKSVFTNAYETVKTIFLNIKSAIQNPIETARDLVKNAIDKMRSFFNFTWSLPKLKMPHITISGSFSLLPPSAPKFSIDWYKNGGIMTDPTIFGFNPSTNSFMAGGEAGAEAIAPISDLQDYVRVAVNESNTEMSERLNGILSILSDYLPNMANYSVVLDSGVLVGELAPQMDESLGIIKRRKGR